MLELKVGDQFEVARPEFGDIAEYEVTGAGIRCNGTRKPEPPKITVHVTGNDLVMRCSACGVMDAWRSGTSVPNLVDVQRAHLERKHS